jgi:uncharacterized membrane protein YesL
MRWLREMWTKEGPGIPKDAAKKRGLALFAEIICREWWEMVKLNLLFILASLPIVTIPAALAAMASVSVALVEDRNTYLGRDFCAAFRKYLWQATMTGFIMGSAIALGVYATVTYASLATGELVFAVPLAISVAATGFICVFACHDLVLMVMRDLPLVQRVRLAALASLARPLPAIAAIGFGAALWLVHILLYPVSVFMPPTLNFSLGMFAVTFGVHRAVVESLSRVTSMRTSPGGDGAPQNMGSISTKRGTLQCIRVQSP